MQNFQVPRASMAQVPQENFGQVIFYINGKKHVLQNPDPSLLLNEYIRSQPGLTGTKKTCGEVCASSMQASNVGAISLCKRSLLWWNAARMLTCG